MTNENDHSKTSGKKFQNELIYYLNLPPSFILNGKVSWEKILRPELDKNDTNTRRKLQ